MIIRYCLRLATKSPVTYDILHYEQRELSDWGLFLPFKRHHRDCKNYICPKQGFNYEITNEPISKTEAFSDAECFVIFSLDEMKIKEDLVWD